MNINRTFKSAILVFLTIPVGTIYIMIMSFLFCDVEIKSDKEIYEINETAHFIVKHKGYIFNPRIQSAEFCSNPVVSTDTIMFIELVSVNLSEEPFIERGSENLFSIKFNGQLIDTDRVKYYPIYVK
jgi:hypothetical protein